MKKQEVLKLNRAFYPIEVVNWRKIIADVVTGAVHPIDVYYDVDLEGNTNTAKISSFNVVRNFAEWAELPVRPYDEYIQTPHRKYRIPPIVVCAKFDQIKQKRGIFPTVTNILKRDKYVCQYTGEHLTRDQWSCDHIIPKSRGGLNTWENLVCCEKSLNIWKGDRTPKECGLKLINQPKSPNGGIDFSFVRDEWSIFLDGGNFIAS